MDIGDKTLKMILGLAITWAVAYPIYKIPHVDKHTMKTLSSISETALIMAGLALLLYIGIALFTTIEIEKTE